MKQSLAIFMAIVAVLAFTSVASAGLVPAGAGDPNIPDLTYDFLTGEVVLTPEGTGTIIGYSLINLGGNMIPGNHVQVLAGVITSTATNIEEAALSAGSGSIGNVFPSGMNLAALTSFLDTNTVSRFLGAPLVPFDLVVVNDAPPIPEPATIAMAFMGLMGLALYGWRRRRCC